MEKEKKKMNHIELEKNYLWIIYNEAEKNLVSAFTTREDALFKLAEYDETASLQITKIRLESEGWMIEDMSWKNLVIDLVKRANSSIDYNEVPLIPSQ